MSDGWHIGGLAGWVCAGSGLFAGARVVAGVVAGAMCEWWLAHWRVGGMDVCGVWLVCWVLECGWFRMGGYVRVAAGTLGGGGAESPLCARGGWRI